MSSLEYLITNTQKGVACWLMAALRGRGPPGVSQTHGVALMLPLRAFPSDDLARLKVGVLGNFQRNVWSYYRGSVKPRRTLATRSDSTWRAERYGHVNDRAASRDRCGPGSDGTRLFEASLVAGHVLVSGSSTGAFVRRAF